MSDRLLTEILLFLLLVLLALLAGAMLAAPLHALIPGTAFSSLAERATLLCGLAFSLLYLRTVRPPGAHALGFWRPHEGIMRVLLKNYAAGVAIMLVAVVLIAGLGLRGIDQNQTFTPAFIAETLIKGLIAGFAASLIEEVIFRGALFTGVKKRINAGWAILLTSTLYAAVHFIEYPDPAGAVHWYSGLTLLPAALAKLMNPAITDHFLTLFLLGVLLCQLRLRQHHLLGCIALHAGVILVIKFDGAITNRIPDSRYDFLVNEFSSRLGWLTAIWLLVLVAAIYLDSRYSRPA